MDLFSGRGGEGVSSGKRGGKVSAMDLTESFTKRCRALFCILFSRAARGLDTDVNSTRCNAL